MPDKPPPDPVWPGMTRKRFDQLGVYIRDTANLLGLYDWRLKLAYEQPDDDDAMAEVKVTFGRRVATIYLCRDFTELSLQDQQHAIVHELLHIHLDPTFSLLSTTLPDLVGQPTWSVVQTAQREREEHAVDALATAISPLLPRLPKR